ncbi:cytochrome c biogenesis protein DipZ, partial [Burkholderia sp. Tr-862]|nr:cytochrome c biogenesis protein DipZ [Burkholderia sp. Tr-862]
MLLIVLAYLGGVLTILSPCILPVLPFVFARADQPFVRTGLPLLIGMALTFARFITYELVWFEIVLCGVYILTQLTRDASESLFSANLSSGK